MRVVCLQTFPIDYCLDFANAIAPLGEVSLLGNERDLERCRAYLDPRIEALGFAWPRHRSFANLRLVAGLVRAIRARDPDVVHFLGGDVSWLAALPHLIGRRALVTTIHDAALHPGDTDSLALLRPFERHLQRRSARVVVHGKSIKRELMAGHGVPRARIGIVPHVALNRYPEVARRAGLSRAADDGQKRVLFFGRIMTYKGLPFLLDALERLRPDGLRVRLVVAGAGPALDELRPRLAAAGDVELHAGFVPDAEVAQLFLDADLVALPYVEASQSGIIAMAAAFGRPVVTSDVGELGEIVRATGMGLVVPPADPAALAAAIRRCLVEPGLAERLAAASRQVAAGAMSPALVCRAAGEVYAAAITSLQALPPGAPAPAGLVDSRHQESVDG